MDQIDQAVYDIVHESEMPAKAIASRISMGHQVLLNKANPQNETHKLSLREAVAIQIITGDFSIYRAMGVEIGADEIEDCGSTISECLLSLTKAHGAAFGAIHNAISDSVLTSREREACQKELDTLEEEISIMRRKIKLYQSSSVTPITAKEA